MEDGTKRRMGRPPRVEGGQYKDAILTENFRFFITPGMKEWILDHGGAGYIRRLVEEDRKRQEAANQRES